MPRNIEARRGPRFDIVDVGLGGDLRAPPKYVSGLLGPPRRPPALLRRFWPYRTGRASIISGMALGSISSERDNGAGNVSWRRPVLDAAVLNPYSAGSGERGVYELCTTDWSSRTNREWA